MTAPPAALRHGRISLALHTLRRDEGHSVLLLHALRGSSADWSGALDGWNGTVYALDFSGHGRSEWLTGGAYTPEILVADADRALQEIGSASVVGAGIGAYIALMLAGSRPDAVSAALLLPGAGLAGGGPVPDFEAREGRWTDLIQPLEQPEESGYDPHVRFLDSDTRPVDYAASFAERASCLLLSEDGNERPAWWQAARGSAVAQTTSAGLAAALRRLAD